MQHAGFCTRRQAPRPALSGHAVSVTSSQAAAGAHRAALQLLGHPKPQARPCTAGVPSRLQPHRRGRTASVLREPPPVVSALHLVEEAHVKMLSRMRAMMASTFQCCRTLPSRPVLLSKGLAWRTLHAAHASASCGACQGAAAAAVTPSLAVSGMLPAPSCGPLLAEACPRWPRPAAALPCCVGARQDAAQHAGSSALLASPAAPAQRAGGEAAAELGEAGPLVQRVHPGLLEHSCACARSCGSRSCRSAHSQPAPGLLLLPRPEKHLRPQSRQAVEGCRACQAVRVPDQRPRTWSAAGRAADGPGRRLWPARLAEIEVRPTLAGPAGSGGQQVLRTDEQRTRLWSRAREPAEQWRWQWKSPRR